MSITVGRFHRPIPDGATPFPVDRLTYLGNPYKMQTEADRARVIAAYALWLDGVLADVNSPQSRHFAKLVAAAREGDIVLLCHCAPKDCHARVIKERIEVQIGVAQ